MSSEGFWEALYGPLPDFFKDEAELRIIWSNPMIPKTLLANLAEAGYGKDELVALPRLIQAENRDLFDVLDYISLARESKLDEY